MKPSAVPRIVSAQPSLAPYSAFLDSITRPSVDISLDKKAGTKEGSRFGGSPYVPADFAWPTRAEGVYRFLGQIGLREIASRPSVLPGSGLLSFFYASPNDSQVSDEDTDELEEEEWDALQEASELEVSWQDPGFVRAYFWPDVKGFKLQRGKIAWRADDESPIRQLSIRESENTAITLSAGVDLPRHQVLRSDWPFNDDVAQSLLNEVRVHSEPFVGHLLGYPNFTTLGYDPSPGDEWVPLLTVNSVLDWCWHDGDVLMVFIEKERLERWDFSRLQCDAG